MPASERALSVGLLYVQYDPSRYRGAFERCLGVLDRVGADRFDVVVVDNAEAGPWYHRLHDGLTHVGGDNSRREFSGFDAGLAYMDSIDCRPDLYVLVTEAFLAYGDAYLDLVDWSLFEKCADLDIAAGWVDSFGERVEIDGLAYDSWVRSSFLILPRTALSAVRPLANGPLPTRVFSDDPQSPFVPEFDPRLAEHLLTWLTDRETSVERPDRWHSAFELKGESYAHFQAKVLAILDEHLISARLRDSAIPCLDLRCLSEWSLGELKELDRNRVVDLAWMGWRDDAVAQRVWGNRPMLFVDFHELPKVFDACEVETFSLSGWAGGPGVDADVPVEIRVGGELVCRARRDRPRPDVGRAYPYISSRCGFAVRIPTAALPAGEHEVEVCLPGTELEVAVGTLTIRPVFECSVDDFLTDPRSPEDGDSALLMRVGVESSCSVASVRVLCDGQEFLGERSLRLRPSDSPRSLYELTVAGRSSWDPQRSIHDVELLFETETGDHREFRHAFQTPDRANASISWCQVDHWDPRTGGCRVEIRGVVHAPSEAATVELRCGGNPVCSAGISVDESGIASFHVSELCRGLQPGVTDLELVMTQGDDLAREQVVRSWQQRIIPRVPRAVVDVLQIQEPASPDEPYWLLLAGHLLDVCSEAGLQLLINEHPQTGFRPRIELADDLARSRQDAVALEAKFVGDVCVRADPGRHRLTLRTQGEDPITVWEQWLEFESCASSSLLVSSKQLARLLEGGAEFHASLMIAGRIEHEHDRLGISLFVDGEEVDYAQVESDGTFHLRFDPGSSGDFEARVVVHTAKRTLYDSGTHPFTVTGCGGSARESEALARFLDTHDLRARLGLPSGVDPYLDVLGLMELSAEGAYELFGGLAASKRDLRAGSVLRFDSSQAKPSAAARRQGSRGGPNSRGALRILMPCWEIPCSRHGGGRWMVQLLAHLGRRHDITVMCMGAAEELHLAEEIRPLVTQVIAMRRVMGNGPIESGLPAAVWYREYSELFKEEVDRLLTENQFDLVDYQYVRMLPYVSERPCPRVLTVFEEPFSAALSRPRDATSYLGRLSQLSDVLCRYQLSSRLLPGAFDELIAVSEADQRMLQEISGDVRVHLNPLGLDLEDYPLGGPSDPEGDQVLCFLGNYRHPPSLEAALYVAERVFPRVRAEMPKVGLRLIGADPPPEMRELHGRDGVEVTGFVDDPVEHLHECSVFVAPIFTGSGMRVKILEAMAVGIPLVASSLAMESIDVEPERGFLLAESEDEFVERCLESLRRPEEARERARVARRLVEAQHSVEALAVQREEIWYRILDAFPRGEVDAETSL